MLIDRIQKIRASAKKRKHTGSEAERPGKRQSIHPSATSINILGNPYFVDPGEFDSTLAQSFAYPPESESSLSTCVHPHGPPYFPESPQPPYPAEDELITLSGRDIDIAVGEMLSHLGNDACGTDITQSVLQVQPV